jgi:predicted TIM-barrel fold metal-dependent hydrolase
MPAASTPVVDTHRHPFGPGAKQLFSSVGAYHPDRPLPQAARGNVFYAEWLDEQTTVAGQRDGGVTRALLSNGGELELLSQLAGGDEPGTLRMLLEDKLELIERHPGDFDLMADANPFDEACQPLVEEALDRHAAKAISVATSWGDGAGRRFLDDPACEWLWELALRREAAVHLHPPMLPVGHEAQVPYRLMEVVGRPCDTALTVARMIYAGTFDRHPELQVVTVHTGGAVPSLVGRLDFGWRLNFKGVADRAEVEPYEQNNELEPSAYLRRNVWADTMGLCARCVRDAIEVYGIDHIVFGTDYGPVPISPREHVDIVLGLGLSSEDEEKILWRNADRLLKLGLKPTPDKQSRPDR